MSKTVNGYSTKYFKFFIKRIRFYVLLVVSVLIGIMIVKTVIPGSTASSLDPAGQDIHMILDVAATLGIVTLIPAVIVLFMLSHVSSKELNS